NRDDTCACVARQRNQNGSEEANSHNGNGLPFADIAAAEDVHCAAERLEREVEIVEGRRQLHNLRSVRDIIFRIGLSAQEPDPIADGDVTDSRSQGVDQPPSFVAKLAGLCRELHPLRSLPRRQIRRADTATLKAHTHMAGTGFRQWDLADCHAARRGHNSRIHETRLNHSSASWITASTASGAMSRLSSSMSSRRLTPRCSAMAEVWRMSRVTSCSARRLICRSSDARLPCSRAIRFWLISTKVERNIASTDATIARTTNCRSHLGTPGI